MKNFEGRVAVITGAASGVGLSLASQLHAAGADVVMADIDTAKLETVAATVTGGGGRVLPIQVDVTKEASVDAFADAVFAQMGKVNLLFNNAGVGLGEAKKTMWSIPINDWRWGMDVNVLGVVHGIKSFVPRMLASGEEGVVVNSSSSNGGLRSLPNTPIYAATKAAVTSISEVLHQQLLREGNRVRAAILFPGPHTVNTAIMASRLVRPADYRNAEPEEPVAYHTMQQLLESTGLKMKLTEPDDVASFALAELQKGKFWLLPESAENDAKFQERAQLILARETPPSAW